MGKHITTSANGNDYNYYGTGFYHIASSNLEKNEFNISLLLMTETGLKVIGHAF